jgi:purine-binding chemotaxis protein CheW
VPIDAVQEIVRVPDELTRVPKTPDFIEGVVNLRGVVLPVVDQRRRFGLPAIERNDRQRIMVYTIRGVRTGFIVDSVSEVMRIPASVIGPAPALSDEQQKLIRRVANIEKQKRMILLLDVDQLLDVKELAAVGKAVE